MDETLPAVLAAAFAAIPEVEAVALGGSRAMAHADPKSDIDLYVYSTKPVPLGPREALAARRSGRAEVDNRFWEPGDEWDEAGTGLHIHVVYRDIAAVREDLSACWTATSRRWDTPPASGTTC